MITVLVVAPSENAEELDRVALRKPSLEVLHARDAEEALERLSRNRRIDAVLLILPPDHLTDVVRVIREEDPGAPPVYCASAAELPQGVRALEGETAEELLASAIRELAS